MKKIIFTPQGVCCKLMEIETSDGIVSHVEFHGGCNGNLQGIARLIEGQKIETVIEKLKGVDCNGRGTSCPDQLASALEINSRPL